MIYTDTRDNSVKADFRTAVMGGMNQATGGLYIPVEFPKLDSSLLNKDPAPSFFVSSLDDSAVAVNMRIWVKTAKYWDMRCKYMKSVKDRFDEVGISIPFPQRVVHIVKE